MLLTAALALSLSSVTIADSPVIYYQAVVADTAEVAADTPATPQLEDAPKLISTLITAIQEKNWQLMVAMIVMLLVLLANTTLLRFNVLSEENRKLALPWIASGTACLLLFSSTLMAGGSWWQALLAGLVTGAAATGLWELVFKHVRKLLEKKPENSDPA